MKTFLTAFYIHQLLDSLPNEYEVKPFLDIISKKGLTEERFYPFELYRKKNGGIQVQTAIKYSSIESVFFKLSFLLQSLCREKSSDSILIIYDSLNSRHWLAEKETLKKEIKQGLVVCNIRVYDDYDSVKDGHFYYGIGKVVSFRRRKT